MQKYYLICSFLITTLIFLTHSPKGVSQELSTKPLSQCWNLDVEGINKTEIASDNVNRIFFSYADGFLTSVSTIDGNQIWKTELGGQTLSVTYDSGILFVVSLNSVEDAVDIKSKKAIVIRAVSSETGIVKWQTKLDTKANGNNSKDSILMNDDNIFFVSSSGEIYRLSKLNGRETEKISLNEDVTTQAILFKQEIYVGTSQKNIDIYSIIEKKVRRIAVAEVPTVILADGEKIIVGDKLGKLTALNIKGDAREWQTRMGAEIANITKIGGGMAVSSNDNFIYFVSFKNGEKLWKKRLAGRTTTVGFKANDVLLAVNLNSDLSTFVETKKGKTVNQVSVQNSRFFVNKPLLLNDMIIFHTNIGLTVYSSKECVKKEKTAD